MEIKTLTEGVKNAREGVLGIFISKSSIRLSLFVIKAENVILQDQAKIYGTDRGRFYEN